MEAHHETVLLEETVAALAIAPNDTLVDATLGGAGHFAAMLAQLGADGTLVGIDADPAAVARGKAAYAADRRTDRPTAHVVQDNFRNLAHILERLQLGAVDGIVFDLGWSGYQLAETRGFSFQKDEPLLMTYGESGTTAAEIVNTASEEDLATMLFTLGEERFARGIARAIVAARAQERIVSTEQLVAAVMRGVPRWYRTRRIHPATKTFQALRIATNDELGALRDGLTAAFEALADGGRLAVITFHSIEDRIVKQALKEAVVAGQGELVHKKPLTPSAHELAHNKRARSAKLRVFERTRPHSALETTNNVTLAAYA